MSDTEYYTAILSIRHVTKKKTTEPVTRRITTNKDDSEVAKIVVRALSLDALKAQIQAHVEIL